MRVGIIQSNYIPWRGYFDFINSVDLFIFHDDLQYTKQDWRNRNKIKVWPQGTTWLTVPVKHERTDQLICETKIDYTKDWRKDHINRFTASCRQSPFLEDALSIFDYGFSSNAETISELNIRLIFAICEYYRIETPKMDSRVLNLKGSKSERLIEMLTKVGAKTYVSGPVAKQYLDEDLFKENNIALEYKEYEYPWYRQMHGDFDPNVTIMDTIANCGPERKYILLRGME